MLVFWELLLVLSCLLMLHPLCAPVGRSRINQSDQTIVQARLKASGTKKPRESQIFSQLRQQFLVKYDLPYTVQEMCPAWQISHVLVPHILYHFLSSRTHVRGIVMDEVQDIERLNEKLSQGLKTKGRGSKGPQLESCNDLKPGHHQIRQPR